MPVRLITLLPATTCLRYTRVHTFCTLFRSLLPLITFTDLLRLRVDLRFTFLPRLHHFPFLPAFVAWAYTTFCVSSCIATRWFYVTHCYVLGWLVACTVYGCVLRLHFTRLPHHTRTTTAQDACRSAAYVPPTRCDCAPAAHHTLPHSYAHHHRSPAAHHHTATYPTFYLSLLILVRVAVDVYPADRLRLHIHTAHAPLTTLFSRLPFVLRSTLHLHHTDGLPAGRSPAHRYLPTHTGYLRTILPAWTGCTLPLHTHADCRIHRGYSYSTTCVCHTFCSHRSFTTRTFTTLVDTRLLVRLRCSLAFPAFLPLIPYSDIEFPILVMYSDHSFIHYVVVQFDLLLLF